MLKWTDNNMFKAPTPVANEKDLYLYSTPLPHDRVRALTKLVNQIITDPK